MDEVLLAFFVFICLTGAALGARLRSVCSAGFDLVGSGTARAEYGDLFASRRCC